MRIISRKRMKNASIVRVNVLSTHEYYANLNLNENVNENDEIHSID